METGYQFRQIRQRKGLSQMQVANLLNTTQPQYNKYETGKQDPTARVIIELCKIFGVTADELLGIEHPQTPA